jgi:hypothetical protein
MKLLVRVMWTRSCVRSTSSAISESLALTYDNGSIVIKAYAKLSLKKYRPIAARNEDAKVPSGLR